MAFLGSLVQYLLTLALMVIVAALGMFAGKKLRDSKDAKTASTAKDEAGVSGQE